MKTNPILLTRGEIPHNNSTNCKFIIWCISSMGCSWGWVGLGWLGLAWLAGSVGKVSLGGKKKKAEPKEKWRRRYIKGKEAKGFTQRNKGSGRVWFSTLVQGWASPEERSLEDPKCLPQLFPKPQYDVTESLIGSPPHFPYVQQKNTNTWVIFIIKQKSPL